jgi:hypothetical protein
MCHVINDLWHGSGLLVITITGDRVTGLTRFESHNLQAFGLFRAYSSTNTTRERHARAGEQDTHLLTRPRSRSPMNAMNATADTTFTQTIAPGFVTRKIAQPLCP